MKKQNIIISVEKPSPIDNDILDTLFNSSIAISNAVSQFWEKGLASSAELGGVIKTTAGYDIEIIY